MTRNLALIRFDVIDFVVQTPLHFVSGLLADGACALNAAGIRAHELNASLARRSMSADGNR